VLEMPFVAEVGVTDAGSVGCRRSEKSVISFEFQQTYGYLEHIDRDR
jgi:hypothetical protein